MNPDHRLQKLRESIFGVLPDAVLRGVADTARETRLLPGHMLYDAEVAVLASGLLRAFISNGTGRQLTIAYIRRGHTLALAHLAGRRYPTAFQALDESQLIVIGDERTLNLQRTHPLLGWAAAQEFSTRLDELEAELGRVAFGSLRQRLATHLLALTSEHQDERYPVHLSQLAAAVASSREVVHRYIRPLEHDGCVTVGSDGVIVIDRDRLRDQANID